MNCNTRICHLLSKFICPDYARSEQLNEDVFLKFDFSQELSNSISKAYPISLTTNDFSQYHTSQDSELINLLSDYVKLPTENILITSGSDQALELLSMLLIDETKNVCIPLPSFYRMEFHTKVNYGNILFISPSEYPYNVNVGLIKRHLIENNVDVLFLSSPNNPTGAVLSQEQIEFLLCDFFGFLILDEALADYTQQTFAQLILSHPNLIIVKTFSKFFKLGGLRIGYLLAEKDVIEKLKALISPYAVTSPAIQASIQRISDHKFIDEQIKFGEDVLATLNCLHNPLILVSQTSTNIVLIEFKGDLSLYEILRKNGYKTVNGNEFRGLESHNTVRVTINDIYLFKQLLLFLNTVSL